MPPGRCWGQVEGRRGQASLGLGPRFGKATTVPTAIKHYELAGMDTGVNSTIHRPAAYSDMHETFFQYYYYLSFIVPV